MFFLNLSYGIKIWTDLSSVLSQCTRVTDGQTEYSSLDRVCIPCSAVKIAYGSVKPTVMLSGVSHLSYGKEDASLKVLMAGWQQPTTTVWRYLVCLENVIFDIQKSYLRLMNICHADILAGAQKPFRTTETDLAQRRQTI